MKIRLYIYNGEVAWARLTVLGVEHITADCRTFGYHQIKKTMEITTSKNSATSEPSNKAMLGFCERDVKQGYAHAIDIEVEPIEKDWKDWGINNTLISFDYNILKTLPAIQE